MIRLTKAFTFIFGIYCIMLVLSALFIGPKSPIGDWRNFVLQPANSIDLIIVGNSHAAGVFSPMQAWSKYGITSWILSSGSISTRHKLAMVEEAFLLQKPKVLAFELYDFGRPTVGERSTNLLMYKTFPLGWPKLSGVIHTVEPQNVQEALIPLLTFHNDWIRFSKEDVSNAIYDFKSTEETSTAGAVSLTSARTEWRAKIWPLSQKKYLEDIEYVYKVAEICKKNNTKLFLFFAPVLDKRMTWYFDDVVRDVSSRYPTVQFLNSNSYLKEIGLTKSDFRDTGHLFRWGMEKNTQWLLENVISEWGLPNKKGASFAPWWNKNADAWKSNIK